MRTVDPEIWSKAVKKPKIQVSRYNKFGQQGTNKYETIFRESFKDAALEFWEHCSAPAVKYINVEDISQMERFCYILLLLLTSGVGTFVVSYVCYSFYVTPPLVLSGQDAELFMSDVSFPAVGICSNNVISRTAMRNYTEFLYNHPANYNGSKPLYNRGEIQRYMVHFGSLLMLAVPPIQLKFGLFLKAVHPKLNITELMFSLSAPCSSVLRRCSWRGQLVPCETLFAERATPLGFCCMFNARYHPDDANNEARVLDLVGQNHGLGVVIVENRDDFLYFRRNQYGAEMLIFEGSEYPLLESGDVRLYPIPRNVSLFVNIKVMVQEANDNVNYYSEQWRGCRTYGPGQSWCLANCRRDTTAALCDCVPYTLHAGYRNDSRRVCGVRDLPCLNKHREKFMYLYPTTPGAAEDPHLSEERQDGLICEHCRVMCRRRLYAAVVSYASYIDKENLNRNFLTQGLDFVNTSTIRLFYNSEQHALYTLEAYLRWYEVVVKLGTQWIVVAGVSALTVIELVYHITFRWPYHFLRRLKLVRLQHTAPSM